MANNVKYCKNDNNMHLVPSATTTHALLIVFVCVRPVLLVAFVGLGGACLRNER